MSLYSYSDESNGYSNGSNGSNGSNNSIPHRRKVSNIRHTTLFLTLEEMYNGTQRIFPLDEDRCDFCTHSSQIEDTDDVYSTCETCGRLSLRTVIHRKPANIHLGSRPGQVISYAPKSGHGDGVVVTLLALDHPVYKLQGDDLHMRIELNESEALCGFKKFITTLDNRKIRVRVRQGKITQSKHQICIKGEGMPVYNNKNYRGDLFIQFEVCTEKCVSPVGNTYDMDMAKYFPDDTDNESMGHNDDELYEVHDDDFDQFGASGYQQGRFHQ